MNQLLSSTQVSQFLNTRVDTIFTWYKWYNDPEVEKPANTPPLPPYLQAHPRAPRYWKIEDLAALQDFKNWVPKGRAGLMGKYNAKNWGRRAPRKEK